MNKVKQAQAQAQAQTNEPFLQRWSRRKQQADQTSPSNPAQPSDTQPSDTKQDSEVETSETPFEQLTDANMPALDSLDEHSDYRPFLAPKVSAELRRLALRKLFHQPVFNIRDGLCEYDDDYTQFEPLGEIVTADMKFMQTLKEQREQVQGEQEQAEPPMQAERQTESPKSNTPMSKDNAMDTPPADEPQDTV